MQNRSRSIDILRIIAIVLVVTGHMLPIPGVTWLTHHFPVYSYHIALFLFASGYLFRDIDWHGYGSFVLRKTKSLAIPLIGWNIVYAMIVTLVNLRHPVNYLPSTERVWTFHNLFVEPFVGGHQYVLNLATWFVGMLFFTLLVYGLFHVLTKRLPDWAMLMVYTAVALCGLYGATLALPRGWLVLLRIAYALFFVQLGRCFRLYVEPRITSRHLWWLIMVVAVVWFFVLLNGDKLYVVAFMNFDGCCIRPLLAGSIGCLFWMLVSIQLSQIISPNELEVLLSRSTWSIMTNHLLVRFMICWTFVHFAQSPAVREVFAADFWFFPRSENVWSCYTLLYIAAIILEVGLPVVWQILFDNIKSKLSQIIVYGACK